MSRTTILLLCALALTLPSCGRQVTPNRTGASANGLQPGQMEIKFTMANPVDFSSNVYVLAFDVTCTAGSAAACEPYARYGTQAQNWARWDYEIAIFQPNGNSTVQAQLWEFINEPSSNGYQKQPYQILNLTTAQLNVIANCNATPMQLCVIVSRALFKGIPEGSATPAPTLNTWYINWLVASAQGFGQGQVAGTPINAPGPQGPNDATWFPETAPNGYDVNTAFDLTWTALQPPTWASPPNPGAQYAGGQVINNP